MQKTSLLQMRQGGFFPVLLLSSNQLKDEQHEADAGREQYRAVSFQVPGKAAICVGLVINHAFLVGLQMPVLRSVSSDGFPSKK